MSMPPNNLPDIRRYITTHSPEGEAVFLSHSQIPEYIPSKPIADEGDLALLFATVTHPINTEDETDLSAYDDCLHTSPGLTTPQGTVLRSIDLRPKTKTPMHRTVSLDYGVVLGGEVDLILDSGQTRTMTQGDVCIQRGTAHSFCNRSETDWCRLLFVFLPMKTINIKGRELTEEVYDEGYDQPDGTENGQDPKQNGRNSDK